MLVVTCYPSVKEVSLMYNFRIILSLHWNYKFKQLYFNLKLPFFCFNVLHILFCIISIARLKILRRFCWFGVLFIISKRRRMLRLNNQIFRLVSLVVSCFICHRWKWSISIRKVLIRLDLKQLFIAFFMFCLALSTTFGCIFGG